MSKTLRKYIRLPIACGNNTPYYKLKRRKIRRIVKSYIRSLRYLNDIDVMEIPDFVFKNSWFEPTDGSWLIGKFNADSEYVKIDKRTKRFKQ
jgi:hypothetical protein